MLAKRYKNDGKSIKILNKLQKDIKRQIGNKIESGEYAFEVTPCPCAVI